MQHAERIVIIGAGIGGLATALTLRHSGCEVLLIERDAPPPEVDPRAAIDAWDRGGVPQFRMAHTLLARLHTILRVHHPEVLQALAAVGIEPCPIALVLPDTQVNSYRPRAADIDLRHLLGRRATFEYVLREQVKRLEGVRFMHGARVEGLRFDSAGAHVRVCGIEVVRGSEREAIDADVVIDASGGRARACDWLRARGIAIEVEAQPSEFAYFCRHYRALDAGQQPFRRTGGALDYLWYGAFFAEHGHFALALACPAAETQLIETIRRAEGFDAIARNLPGVAPLLARSEASGKVLGAPTLSNRWTRYVVKNAPEVLGFFAVGDSHVQTNPMYGRGCAAAFVQAHALADALRESRDPATRARRYSEKVWKVLRPQYDFCVAGDQLFTARGRRSRGEALPRAMRGLDYLTDQVWAPSVLASPFIAREAVKTLQGQDMSSFWTRIAAIACMLFVWLRRGFRTTALVPERSGPPREELLHRLEQVISERPPAQAAAAAANAEL